MKNVLILSNYLPNQGWGGGVIIRSLTENYPENLKMFWTTFNIQPNQKNIKCNNIEVIDFQTQYFRGRGFSDVILQFEMFFFVRDFNKLIRNNNIDLLWIVVGADYPNLVMIHSLVKKIKIPFHISIHDDPILEIPIKKQKATRLFKEILQKANTIDVISTRMQIQYKNDFNVNSIVITRCIPEDFPKNSKATNEKINILMGGSGNATLPWPKPLLDSIHKLNQTNNWQLHLFDSKLKSYESSVVKVYDLMSEQSFNTILETTNIGYACDDLKLENIKFAQLSLPTKIVTYIGAGIPFLYHGPKDSTVGDLLKQYVCGIIIETNTPNDLTDGFLKLISNYNFYQENCILAKENLFSIKVVQNHFFNYILRKNQDD
ncbi:MAG: hypothetical protein V4548_04285 [Bacteroidota bacterium]